MRAFPKQSLACAKAFKLFKEKSGSAGAKIQESRRLGRFPNAAFLIMLGVLLQAHFY